jgi:hypothetical protein
MWIHGDVGRARRVKRFSAITQLDGASKVSGVIRGTRDTETVNVQRGERGDEVENLMGVASVSREIGCGRDSGRPWGASGLVSVKAGSSKAREGMRWGHAHCKLFGPRNLEGKKPMEAPTSNSG